MSLSINIFKDMGRRKFQLAHHRRRDTVQKDLLLYLNELISDESEPVAESSDWITIVNRGGLVMVKKHGV